MPQNFDDYRVFFYVAREGNMRQASQILGLTPPTVTRVIKNMEQSFGCELFIRTRNGVLLTDAGELLYSHVKPAFQILQSGESELNSIALMGSTSVNIGVSDVSSQHFLLPLCLRRFCAEHSNIKVCIRHLSVRKIEDALISGDLDFALMSAFFKSNEHLKEEKIIDLNDIAIAGPSYSHLSTATVSLEQLSHYPLILVPENYRVFSYYETQYKKLGCRFKPYIETPILQEQLLAVQLNLGYTFVPELAAQPLLETGSVIKLPVVSDVLLQRQMCLLTSREIKLTKAAQIFIEIIRDAASKISVHQ